jgi:hypothetical protein
VGWDIFWSEKSAPTIAYQPQFLIIFRHFFFPSYLQIFTFWKFRRQSIHSFGRSIAICSVSAAFLDAFLTFKTSESDLSHKIAIVHLEVLFPTPLTLTQS